MYLSPKSSSSSICLLRDWARSHLYSLPGLTICNPSNKLWSFLDRLYTLNTLLYSKTGPARQDTDFAKITKFQDLGKQCERSLCSLKIQNFNKITNQLNPQQNFNKNAFQTQNPTDVAQRVHNPATPFAKYSNISQSHSSFLQLCKPPKFRNLSKQRERSLCSLKIKILTNYPTHLTPSKILIKMLFINKIQRAYATRP